MYSCRFPYHTYCKECTLISYSLATKYRLNRIRMRVQSFRFATNYYVYENNLDTILLI